MKHTSRTSKVVFFYAKLDVGIDLSNLFLVQPLYFLLVPRLFPEIISSFLFLNDIVSLPLTVVEKIHTRKSSVFLETWTLFHFSIFFIVALASSILP